MKNWIVTKRDVRYAWILFAGKLCSEVHSIARRIYPPLYKIIPNLFITGNHPYVDAQWQFKMVGEDIDRIFVSFVLAMYVKDKSFPLFIFCWFFIFYNFIDLFLFLWNFKSTPEVYWTMIFIALIGVFLLIFNKSKLTAI